MVLFYRPPVYIKLNTYCHKPALSFILIIAMLTRELKTKLKIRTCKMYGSQCVKTLGGVRVGSVC